MFPWLARRVRWRASAQGLRNRRIPPGLLVGLCEAPLGGGPLTGLASGPFLAEPTGGRGVNLILVQAFVSLGVVTQYSIGGGDDGIPPWGRN